MNKLFIGSLGAFGVVLETTYRLVALPQDDSVLAVLFPTLAQATAAAAALRATPLLPSALLLLHADVVSAWNAALPWQYNRHRWSCCSIVTVSVRPSHANSVTAVPCARHTGAWRTPPWQVRPCPPCGHSGRTGVMRFLATVQPWLHVRLGVVPTRLEATLTYLAQTPTFCQQPIGWVADAGHGQIWALPGTPAISRRRC